LVTKIIQIKVLTRKHIHDLMLYIIICYHSCLKFGPFLLKIYK
jgi:hypothetical protein